MNRLHVAVLDEELPFPLTSGKRIRSFQLLTRLAQRHRVTLITHRNADDDELRDAAQELRRHDIFPIAVPRKIPAKKGLGFYARLGSNLLSPLPYSVTSHTSKAMHQAMAKLRTTDRPDLWHCEWTPYAQAMYQRPEPWVVMAHNVEARIWERYARTEADPLKKWYITQQWKKFDAFERWAYSAASRAIAVSAEDATYMEQEMGASNVAVVDNGVAIEQFRPNPSEPRQPHRLLFLGSLDWRPNQDALTYFLDAMFPTIVKHEPATTLAIVGRKPPTWLQARVASMANVELHADVPDVLPYLHQAGQLIVPLRVGGGSRLKILEALATGLPVVTTTIGVEGLRLHHQEHCTIADGPDDFVLAVLETIRQPKAAQMLAQRGRNKVLAEYNWDTLAKQLDVIWQTTAARENDALRAAA